MRLRTKWPAVALFLGLCGQAFAPASAADEPLALVPRDAWGLVIVPRVGEAEATLERLGQEMQLPAPSLLQMAGIQQGLDREGAALAIVMPGGEGKRPAVIVALPTSDYDQLLKPFNPSDAEEGTKQIEVRGRKYLVAPKGKYALFSGTEDREVLEKVLQTGEEVPGNLRGLQPWFAEHAVGLAMLRPGVEVAGEAAIKALETAKERVMNMAAQAEEKAAASADEKEQKAAAKKPPPKVAAEQAAQGIDLYLGVARCLQREMRMTAGAVRLDDRGSLRIDWRTRFAADGEAARVLATVKPAEKDVLADLPAQPFVFAAGGVLSAEMSDAMMEWSVKLMGAAPDIYGITPEQADEMAKVAKESMGSLRGMGMLMGVGETGDPLYANFLVTMRVDDTEKFLANYTDYIAKMNEIIGDRPSIMSHMEVEKTEVAGRPGIKLTMDVPRMPNADQVPNYDRMMELMFGPGGKITTYMAAADDQTLVASYINERLLEQAIESAKEGGEGLGGREDVRAAAARLPKQAAWRLYVSPAGMIGFAKRAMAASLPEGAPRFELPDFPETPAIAWAGSAGKAEFREQTIVPAEVLKALVPYAGQVRQQFQAAMAKQQADRQKKEPAEQ